MKNWLAPLVVLGISGLGLACTSERGRVGISAFVRRLNRSGDPFGEVNRFIDEQLSVIQKSLDHLAEVLDEQEA